MPSGTLGLLRRIVAAVLVVALPAMSGSMALPGPGSAVAPRTGDAHSHSSRHDGCGGPRHQSTHHECCGIGCGCSVQVGAAGLRGPATVIAIHTAPPPSCRAVRVTRARHLLPPALGPPTPLA